MNLADLLEVLPASTIHGEVERDVGDITFDSRTVRPGSLFVAVRGWEQDGHRYVPDAIGRGAVAVVAEESANWTGITTQVIVPSSRLALALLAAAFYGTPAMQLKVIGVTGTDGKTTTTALIGSILRAAGRNVGVLSTIRAEYGGRAVDTGLHTTTPNPVDVQRLMREMVDAGAEFAVLETTSHALDQERTAGCEFDVAVVTNVTPEHLDYHRTYGHYLATKSRLFHSLSGSRRKPSVPKVSVVNADDSSFGYLREFAADRQLSYSIDGYADVSARAVDLRPGGSRFQVVADRRSFVVETPLPGVHNVYNCLAAITVALALEAPLEAIVAGVKSIGVLAGRWERVETGLDFEVVVDFAHTPHALEQALKLARTQARGRVIAVFGCAGQRDKFKRPVMGEIAGRLADIAVLTAEDPRTEDVEDIMREIAAGAELAGRQAERDYFQVGDRQAAVEFAVQMAEAGDIVLLAGKGHEQSMCIGDIEWPWSEHDAVKKALLKRRAAGQEDNMGR